MTSSLAFAGGLEGPVGLDIFVDVGGPEDLLTEEVDERGDEGKCCEECDEDTESKGETHGLYHLEGAKCQSGETDHDGDTGCGDGFSSPHDCFPEGVLMGCTGFALVSVPGDDEDRIVASGTEHDDEQQGGSDVIDSEELSEGPDQGQGDTVCHTYDCGRYECGDNCIEEQCQEDKDKEDAERVDLLDIFHRGVLGIISDCIVTGDKCGEGSAGRRLCLGDDSSDVTGLVRKIVAFYVVLDGDEQDTAGVLVGLRI